MDVSTDVENWDAFLKPINICNINCHIYQCNNPCILIPITPSFISAWESKNKRTLIIIFETMLQLYDIGIRYDNYFVKISSISGKDIIEKFDEESMDNINIDVMWEEINADTKKLIPKSTDDLYDYFTKSKRISEYIKKDKFIVFRKWIDYNVEEEFRCFIYNKKLVAISQAEFGIDLPEKNKSTKIIIDCINNFFNEVLEFIPYTNVVMDVALKFDTLCVYFIEFNEFGAESDTDAALYDWIHDKDILYGKNDNIDLRLYSPEYIEKKYQI